MRRLFILLIFTLVIGSAGAQSLSLFNPDGPLPNNSMVVLWGGDEYIETKAFIRNNTDADMNVMLRSTGLSVVYGTYYYFCWGQCWPDTTASAIPVLIHANTTDSLNFACHYICQGNNGTSIIRYTFFDIDNPLDTVCLNVTFNANTGVGISNPDLGVKITSVYPNPASGSFRLTYNLMNEANKTYSLEIRNLQGSLVHEEILNSSNTSQTIDLKSVSPGMYFCKVTGDGAVVYNSKVMVK